MNDAQAAIERFVALLAAARPPTGGTDLDAIEAEVAPILPVLVELPAADRAEADFASFEFRESFTLLTLLGRRLALLDLTPTAALQVADIALAAAGEGEPPDERFAVRARIAIVEGFVRGREERVAEIAERRAARPVRPLQVDDAIYALIITGVHDAEPLGEHVEALGRAMLDAGASVAIVDLSQLDEPNRDRARAIFAAEEITRMLGAACVFSGVGPRWRNAAEDAHIDLDELRLVRTFAEALDAARALSRPTRAGTVTSWRGFLDRLRR